MTSRISTNARTYGIRYNQRAKAIEKEVTDVMKRVQRDALAAARDMSSGPFGNPATLRRLGHPYARRRPVPIGAAYPAMINVNTGRFKAAWKTSTRINRASISVKLANDSPEARFLTERGTKKMVGRPVLEAIQERVPRGTAARPTLGAASGTTVALRKGLQKAVGRPVGAMPDVAGAFQRGYHAGVTGV
jgi:hypothetical protein